MATSVREKIVRIEESPSKESGGEEISNALIASEDDMNARIIAQLDIRPESASGMFSAGQIISRNFVLFNFCFTFKFF